MSRSHPSCQTEAGHICAFPSHRTCIERGCSEPAGTRWGPMWCPVHDAERLDRIDTALATAADYIREQAQR